MTERFFNYTPPISEELRNMHESALANEFRWVGGFQYTEKEESNLDHLASMFDIHAENSIYRPHLFAEVDTDETNHMIYIHDTGEIGGYDLPHSTPDYENKRAKVKKRERANFRMITRDHIDDPELKAYVREIYKRYEDNDPNDIVSQYVHLIDKIQANRFGAENVFPARKLRTKAEREQQVNHIYGITIEHAENLFREVNYSAQDEILELMDNEMMVLRENGYRASEVDPYRELLQEKLLSQRENFSK